MTDFAEFIAAAKRQTMGSAVRQTARLIAQMEDGPEKRVAALLAIGVFGAPFRYMGDKFLKALEERDPQAALERLRAENERLKAGLSFAEMMRCEEGQGHDWEDRAPEGPMTEPHQRCRRCGSAQAKVLAE